MKEFMMDIPFEIPVSRVHLLEHRLVDVRGIRLDALLVLLATDLPSWRVLAGAWRVSWPILDVVVVCKVRMNPASL
jgi:hypothetical protein